MKELPIGISDFKELIDQDYYYVDKSLLIEELARAGKVVLIPRPRRFGKTLNLSMVRYFFEKNGEDNQYLFTNLKIWEKSEYRSYNGKYPVIFLTFKDIKEQDWAQAYARFALVIAREFKRHSYLLKFEGLDVSDRERFERILSEKGSRLDLSDSLFFLAQLLHDYHHKKVIVLIDEYDMPIHEGYIRGYYDEALNFVRSLLGSVLKDSIVLEKGVLTGILTLAKAGIFSGLNNLQAYNLTEDHFSDKFGFTRQETEKFLRDYAIQNADEMKEWYDGYTFGKTSEMYNPWSILNCAAKKGQTGLYWVNTSDNILVKTLLAKSSIEMKSELEQVLSGLSVPQTIEEMIVFPDLDYRAELAWSLLLFSGYLTYESCTAVKGKKQCLLKIPNLEIRYLYIDLLQEIVKKSVVGGQVVQLFQSMIEGNTPIFTNLLQGFVANSMSFYDISSNEPEKSYHLFVLGILVTLSDQYQVKSNRESGLGRYDVMLLPKKTSLPGIVIEFKVVQKGETLENTARQGIEQIIEKKYAHELAVHGGKPVLAYGIAFEGKNVFIELQNL